ncbi:MAG: TIGR00303 family protein [Elainellaceae cyanobacterium]
MIRIYSEEAIAQPWLEAARGHRPLFACVLGFTETGLTPGISAAGATPDDRRFTAIADAEFLWNGVTAHPRYPLPPLHVGASPVLISRAVVEQQGIPVQVLNAGLSVAPAIPAIDLAGSPARCVSTGEAMTEVMARHLFQQGQRWGDRLAAQLTAIAAPSDSSDCSGAYLVLGECVVGGTTTALAVLTGLGWSVAGKVNSSHPHCNHQQKQQIVDMGLAALRQRLNHNLASPLQVVAAVGDPMQVVVAGMMLAASRTCRVLLAGGTQMLAVWALAQALAEEFHLRWNLKNVIVGTTRWVAEDSTGDTVGLAQLLRVPLVATQLSFATARYEQLRAYERGFVKEGVGAGGCAIAAHLYLNWGQIELLQAIEVMLQQALEAIAI